MNDDQAVEIEATQAIFGDEFQAGDAPNTFSLALRPCMDAGEVNHVAVDLFVTLPEGYPYDDIAQVKLVVVKGLDEKLAAEVTALATRTSEENRGGPSVYTVAEAVRDWLKEHNEPGLDGGSAYDDMMRRQRAKEKEQQKAAAGTLSGYARELDPSLTESQRAAAAAAAAAALEDELTRRRREGTPVTVASFLAWRERFEAEMEAAAAAKQAADLAAGGALALAAQAAGRKAAAKAATAAGGLAGAQAAGLLTGRQMFEMDSSLATSDVGAGGGAAGGAGEDEEEEEGDIEVEGEEGEEGGAGGAGTINFAIDESLFLAGEGGDLDDLDGLDDEDEDDA